MTSLILEYIAAVQEMDVIQRDEWKGSNIKKHNSLADRIRKISFAIERNHPEQKAAFSQLLAHESPSVRIWAAHHMLEVMNFDRAYRAQALKEIENVAAHDSDPDGLGNKMWLEQWDLAHPAEKAYL